MKNNIVIIGTKPACPRCGFLTSYVTEKVKETGIEADIRHIPYNSPEAQEYAGTCGLTPGTAKDVAKLLNIDFNLPQNLRTEFADEFDSIEEPFKQKLKEVRVLDENLRQFEERAKEVGIMMTPVLIINGEIKHQGSVPPISKINEYISELKN